MLSRQFKILNKYQHLGHKSACTVDKVEPSYLNTPT